MNNGLNSKKSIGVLITILLIVIFVVILILLYLKRNDNTQYMKEANGENFFEYYSTTRDAYFDVNSCMRTYLGAISTKNNILYSEDKEAFNNKIYDLLSDNYIKQNDITLENLQEYVENIEEQVIFVPLEIAEIENDTLKSFIVHGLAENIIDLSVVKEVYAVVNLDIEKDIFSIEPIYGNYNSINEIEITELESVINENSYNKFSRNQPTYEDMAKDYINLYKRLAIGHPEKMYELLDEDYRTAKFGSKEDFKKFVEENKKTIIGIRLEKYNAVQENDYTKYTCIDQYGNYYIFIENAILDYSILLDTYTIDLPEFTENYKIATTEEKVGMNIQKIVEALKRNGEITKLKYKDIEIDVDSTPIYFKNIDNESIIPSSSSTAIILILCFPPWVSLL